MAAAFFSQGRQFVLYKERNVLWVKEAIEAQFVLTGLCR
jgi:hypothetical protein